MLALYIAQFCRCCCYTMAQQAHVWAWVYCSNTLHTPSSIQTLSVFNLSIKTTPPQFADPTGTGTPVGTPPGRHPRTVPGHHQEEVRRRRHPDRRRGRLRPALRCTSGSRTHHGSHRKGWIQGAGGEQQKRGASVFYRQYDGSGGWIVFFCSLLQNSCLILLVKESKTSEHLFILLMVQ